MAESIRGYAIGLCAFVIGLIILGFSPIITSIGLLSVMAFYSITKTNSDGLFLIAIMFLGIVATLLSNSYPLSSDIASYYDYYNKLIELTFGAEIVYPTLAFMSYELGVPFRLFTFLISLAGYYSIYYVVYQIFGKTYATVVVIILVSIFPILIYRQVFLVRQYIGAIFFLLCLYKLEEKDRTLSYVFGLLAILSHFSYAIFAWIYIKNVVVILADRWFAVAFLIIAVIFPFSVGNILDITSLIGIDLPYVVGRKISYYANGALAPSVSLFKPIYIFSFVPFLLFLFLDKTMIEKKYILVYGAVTLFSFLLLIFFRDVSILSGRLAFFLSVYSPLLACIFIYQYKMNNRPLVLSCYAALVVSYFVAWIYQNDSEATSLILADGDLASLTVADGLINLIK